MADSYNDYPKAASENAKRALKFREETDNQNGCGTPVGWARANQLANGENISEDTIKRMASFNRHRQNKDVPYKDGCGGLMWDAWGGTEGVDWAIRKSEQIDREKSKAMAKKLNQIEFNILGTIDSFLESNKGELKTTLDTAEGKPIVFNIASEGGDFFEGLAMAELIAQYTGETTAKGVGLVASAATLIMMACDQKMMSANSYFMIHSAWTMVEGNADKMQKSLNLLNSIDEQMAKIYTDQIQSKEKLIKGSYEKTLEMVRQMMKNETWMTASEAMDLGFIDGVIEDSEIDGYKNYEAVMNKVRAQSKFKNIPKLKNETVMNDKKTFLQQLATFFGMKAEYVEEVVEEKEMPASEMEIEIEKSFDDYTPEEKIDWYKKRIAELESGMSEMESKMKEMAATMEMGEKKMEEAAAVALAKQQNYKVAAQTSNVQNSKYTKDQIKASNDLVKQLFKK
jgi:ATP-dependent Clp protease protease subunit